MKDREKLAEKLGLMIQKANRSLDAARRLAAAGDYDFASARAYYAAFYGIQAALLSIGLSPSKHSGAIHLFNQHFIKTELFPADFSKLIGRLFSERQTGDYTFDLRFAETDATQNIEMAETVLQAITAYLVEQGLMPEYTDQ